MLQQQHNTLILSLNDTDAEAEHVSAAAVTPVRQDAFDIPDSEKIHNIAFHFREIMHILGLDLEDDSLKDTPMRVAKMYVNELFSGLHPENKPAVSLFDNGYKYNEMLLEKHIPFISHCEHHFVPIPGKAHIAYFTSGKVIGLSKLNRIVDYYARRPQVQERLTVQIGQELQAVLNTKDVAVIIDAAHMCVSMRGIKHEGVTTVTGFYGGRFEHAEVKQELLMHLK